MKRDQRFRLFTLTFALLLPLLNCDGKSRINATFLSSPDNIKLAGTVTLPGGTGPFPAVVLITGSGPHTRDTRVANFPVMKIVSDYFADLGIASVRYDKRGCGDSEGVYEPHNLANFTNDAVAAVQFLASVEQVDSKEVGVLGLSQGGLIAPAVNVYCPDLAFIVLMAAPGVWGKDFALAIMDPKNCTSFWGPL